MSRLQRMGGDVVAFAFFMAVFAMVGLICLSPTTPSNDTNRRALDSAVRP